MTVSVALLLVFPSLAAVMVVVPGDWPVATPDVAIVATPVLLELNAITRPVSTLPPASFVTTVNAGVFEPSTTDCVVGEMVTLATGIAVTVSVAAGLFCPSLDAMIDVVPAATPVATPVLEFTVATPGAVDEKVTVRPVSTLPLPSFVTAVNAEVCDPATTVAVRGEIVTLATGIAETVSVALLLVLPSLVAVMFVVPGATPVATPVVGSTVATAVLLDANVITRPFRMLPLPSLATAVNGAVFEPTSTDADVGEITTLATGTASTTIVAVPVFPSLVAVTVSVPGASAATRPVLDTLATLSSLPSQTIVRPVRVLPLPSSVVAASCTA